LPAFQTGNSGLSIVRWSEVVWNYRMGPITSICIKFGWVLWTYFRNIADFPFLWTASRLYMLVTALPAFQTGNFGLSMIRWSEVVWNCRMGPITSVVIKVGEVLLTFYRKITDSPFLLTASRLKMLVTALPAFQTGNFGLSIIRWSVVVWNYRLGPITSFFIDFGWVWWTFYRNIADFPFLWTASRLDMLVTALPAFQTGNSGLSIRRWSVVVWHCRMGPITSFCIPFGGV